jgi:hypothetical protein
MQAPGKPRRTLRQGTPVCIPYAIPNEHDGGCCTYTLLVFPIQIHAGGPLRHLVLAVWWSRLVRLTYPLKLY